MVMSELSALSDRPSLDCRLVMHGPTHSQSWPRESHALGLLEFLAATGP